MQNFRSHRSGRGAAVVAGGDEAAGLFIIEGVREGYLLNPVVVDARTEITTELPAEEGYSVMQ